MSEDSLVIVGASYAGLNAAASARTAGYEGAVVLLGDEPRMPYQRPPLSKEFLKGAMSAAQLMLRPATFYEANAIEVRQGHRAVGIDRKNKQVTLHSGEHLPYDKLILATGCRPRMLAVPGADAAGIHYLRTMDDALLIAQRAESSREVVIVGGGFIGLEIAASLRLRGQAVGVVEAQPRLLARAMPALLSDHVRRRHEREGVTFHFGAQIASFQVASGHVTGVVLTDGTQLRADLVVVGVGVLPNQELAEHAGLACANGILVDEFARTSDESIFAAGDCTSHPNAYFSGERVRLECVQNAIDQGRVAGSNAAGSAVAYSSPPWFWSDQYDMKLQGAGFSTGADRHVVRGSMGDEAFSVFHYRGDRLMGVDSINKPGEHMAARKLLAAGVPLAEAQAADAAYDLRMALKA
jgi:3-phenylpropionate/trans-cinnamate dioxygenase ferredoxin reductase subunit